MSGKWVPRVDLCYTNLASTLISLKRGGWTGGSRRKDPEQEGQELREEELTTEYGPFLIYSFLGPQLRKGRCPSLRVCLRRHRPPPT